MLKFRIHPTAGARSRPGFPLDRRSGGQREDIVGTSGRHPVDVGPSEQHPAPIYASNRVILSAVHVDGPQGPGTGDPPTEAGRTRSQERSERWKDTAVAAEKTEGSAR